MTALGIILYWYAGGITEGATTLYRWHGVDSVDSANYHTWRLIESFSILVAVCSASFIGTSVWEIAGGWMVGYWGYLKSFSLMVGRKDLTSPHQYSFSLFGKVISFIIPSWFAHLSLILGLSLLLIHFFGVVI